MSTYGMLCFSADWRDPVIWSHYSDKHRGLCLGFEIPDEKCLKVKYVEKRLPFPATPTLADADVLHSTKFINWKYEQEIRVWAELNDSEQELYFAPFGEILRLVKVFAGARCSLSESKIVEALGPLAKETTLLKARAGFGKFEIVKDERDSENLRCEGSGPIAAIRGKPETDPLPSSAIQLQP